MRNIGADNVSQVLISGSWQTPESGTFELVSGHRLFSSAEPLFRFLDADGSVVMGRLSAIAAVVLSSEPADEPSHQVTPPLGTTVHYTDPNMPGRPAHLVEPALVHNVFRSTAPTPSRIPSEFLPSADGEDAATQ